MLHDCSCNKRHRSARPINKRVCMDKSVHVLSILQLRITSRCVQSNKRILINRLHYLSRDINHAVIGGNGKQLTFAPTELCKVVK